MVAVAISLDPNGRLSAGPDVSLRGLIIPRGMPVEELVIRIRKEALTILDQEMVHDPSLLKSKVEAHLNEFFANDLKSSPLVHVLVMRANIQARPFDPGSNIQARPFDPQEKKVDEKGRRVIRKLKSEN